MKMLFRIACVCVVFTAQTFATESESSANPLGKVIELLDVLSKGIEKEGQEDQKSYKAYSKWYNNETETSIKVIKHASDQIEQLTSDLKEAEAFREGKNRDLEDLANKMAANSRELSAGREGRRKERKTFEKNEETFIESIDQLTRSLAVMAKKQPAAANAAASASLVSIAQNLKTTLTHGDDITLSTAQREVLDSFMRAIQASASAASPSFLQVGSHGPYGEFKSNAGGLVQTLTDLKGRVEKERDVGREAEAKAKKEFVEFESGLTTMLENGKKSMGDIKSSIAQSQEQSSKNQASLMQNKEIHEQETKYWRGVETEYRKKTQGYKIRLAKRSDERIAVHEAVRILSNDAAKAYIAKQRVGMPKKAAASFLQLSEDKAKVRRAALQVIKKATTPGLALLALKTTVHFHSFGRYHRYGHAADPFKKVKSMIKGMLAKLNDKQAQESKHAAWCDSELGKTNVNKKRKQEDVQKLKDRLDALQAELTQNKADLAEVNQDFKQLNAAMADAQKIRDHETKTNTAAIKNYKDGVTLLTRGLKVLKGYYENAEGGGREVDKKEFKDRNGLGTGIIALLEIAIDDFQQLYEETKTNEDSAASDFREMKSESSVRSAVFQKDLEWNSRTKVKLEFDEATMSNDLKSDQKELTAIDSYLSKLKASCVVKGPSYAERKARREAELASLKEALDTLNAQAL